MAKGQFYQYEIGFASHKGMVKEINEDNYCVERREDENEGCSSLVAISDGVGGFSLGEIASKIAINQMEKFFKMGEFKQMLDEAEFLEPSRVIQELYTRINHVVMSLMEKENRQVGCTLVSGFFHNNEIYIASVGNSRAYLIRGNGIKKLTEEKKDPLQEKRMEHVSDEDSFKTLKSGAYVNAMGSDIALKADISSFKAKEGDIFLFCSDGLYTQLKEVEIVNILRENPTMQSFCNALIEQANMAGGKDNITIIAVKVLIQKQSLKGVLTGIKKGEGISFPVLAIGFLILAIILLGSIFLVNKYVIKSGSKGKQKTTLPDYPRNYPDAYNSLTLKTDIPIKYVIVNQETRELRTATQTFAFEGEKNEVEIVPDLKSVSTKLYTITISGYSRNLSVVQSTKNRVIITSERITVHLTVGSGIEFNTERERIGDQFVLKIDNLGSPFIINMEAEENISVILKVDARQKTGIPGESPSPAATPTSPEITGPDGLIEMPGIKKGEKLEYKLK